MHTIVRLITDDDGEANPDAKLWHLVDPGMRNGEAALCTGEYFGEGEQAVGVQKTVKRGGITCPLCLDKLKDYKAIRL